MEYGKQIILAKRSGLSEAFVSLILSGRKRTGWENAKRLAEITNTDPAIWMDGDLDQMKVAVSRLETRDER